MHTKSDVELLRDYAANNSEAAFGEIVRRYADFVYSAALRHTNNPHQAEEITQAVFVIFAREAPISHFLTNARAPCSPTDSPMACS